MGMPKRCRQSASEPLNLGTYHVDDLVRQAGDVLVAEVDCDSGLLLLQLSRGGLGGGADVTAGVLESRACQLDHLLVRDGRGRVVAHGERARYGRSGSVWSRVIVAYMLFAWTATVNLNQVRSTCCTSLQVLGADAASLLLELASLQPVRSRRSRLETSSWN